MVQMANLKESSVPHHGMHIKVKSIEKSYGAYYGEQYEQGVYGHQFPGLKTFTIKLESAPNLLDEKYYGNCSANQDHSSSNSN